MLSLMNRTVPSPKRTLTPPEWFELAVIMSSVRTRLPLLNVQDFWLGVWLWW